MFARAVAIEAISSEKDRSLRGFGLGFRIRNELNPRPDPTKRDCHVGLPALTAEVILGGPCKHRTNMECLGTLDGVV